MDEVIFIGLVFFAVGIGIVWMLQVAKKTKLNWMLAARRLGLKAGTPPSSICVSDSCSRRWNSQPWSMCRHCRISTKKIVVKSFGLILF